MVEYGLVMIMWFESGARILHHVGPNCENILTYIFNIVGKGHDYIVLACELTVGV